MSEFFYLRKSEIMHLIRHPASMRGALRVVTNVRRDAVDADIGAGRAAMRGRPSRVVPIPRRWDQPPGWRCRPFGLDTPSAPGGWWPESPAHQGEHEAAVNTIRAGKAGRSGGPVVTTRVLFLLHTRLRVLPGIRLSLRPPIFEGRGSCRTRVHAARMQARVLSISVGWAKARMRRAHHPAAAS